MDAEAGRLEVDLSAEELDRRRQAWQARPTMYPSGALWRYAQTVGPAYLGAVTHPGAKAEIKSYAEI
jgi:dihydroxy-acid dehydratase